MQRPRRGVMLAVVVAACPVAWAASVQPAPATRLLPAYLAAVRDYQVTGSLERAQRIVGGWPRESFDEVIDLALKSRDQSSLIPAAVFHLDIAASLAPRAPDGALVHIRFGERLVREGAAGVSDTADGVAVVGRWYAAAASVFLAQTDVPRARPIVERGLQAAAGSARLHATAGVLEDMQAQQLDPEVAQDAGGSQLAMRREAAGQFDRRGRLALAERAYRQALRLDASLMVARIRLGRVLSLLDRPADARAMLEAALADATSPTDRYLACLFLAELHQRAGELDDAARLLSEARADRPDRQTAWVALAAIEEMSGRPARARAIVQQGLAALREPSRDEWWDYRNGALDEEGLAWLRARVRP